MTSIAAMQVATIATGLSLLAFAPPSHGKMLLIPLQTADSPMVAALATAQGASLISAGPMRGSLVVYGARAHLAPAMLRSGILVLAAPAMVCGDIS